MQQVTIEHTKQEIIKCRYYLATQGDSLYRQDLSELDDTVPFIFKSYEDINN